MALILLLLNCTVQIGGGIDQDYRRSPYGYTDSGVYVTEVSPLSPADKAGHYQNCMKHWIYKILHYELNENSIIIFYIFYAGLRMHDKILQCNGYLGYINSNVLRFFVTQLFNFRYDFTMTTHKKAVDYVKKHAVLNLLIARKGVTST